MGGCTMRLAVGLCLVAMAGGAACFSGDDPTADLPPLEGVEQDPARLPRVPDRTPECVGASHLLVAYRHAAGARPEMTRTRDQARQRAGHLVQLARARGADFADLAKRFTDDGKSAMDGGDLGAVCPGQLHPAVEQAAFSLGLGQVSDPVESCYGFHVVMRHPPSEVQAAEIVITYNGAARYTPREPRDAQQASELAEQVHQRLSDGADFATEALAHSDLANHVQGGFYPVFRAGDRHPEFEKIVFGLPVGGLSEIVETPTGFHIVKRFPVRRVQVREIMIRYRSEAPRNVDVQRTWQQARALAESIRREALAPGADFSLLASRHTEGAGKHRGGLLEPFGRAKHSLAFERAAFGLGPGEISEVLETEEGFHVIKRVH